MSLAAAGMAAAAFGVGDFLGGVAARDSDWRQVVSVALGSGLLVLGLAASLESSFPASLPLGWCLVAGAGYAIGISLLYRALSEGHMTEIAPISAIVAIVVPAVVDILTGKAVTARLVLGLVSAGVSATLLSGLSAGWRDSIRNHSLIVIAIAAGLGLALFYIGLDRVDAARGGAWGVLFIRAIAFVSTAVVALRRPGRALQPRSTGAAVGAGLFDGTANLLLMMAFATGRLAETSAVASLYPVATILLAVIILQERPSRTQGIGLLLVIPSIFLLKSS